jgi:hypothetical protein
MDISNHQSHDKKEYAYVSCDILNIANQIKLYKQYPCKKWVNILTVNETKNETKSGPHVAHGPKMNIPNLWEPKLTYHGWRLLNRAPCWRPKLGRSSVLDSRTRRNFTVNLPVSSLNKQVLEVQEHSACERVIEVGGGVG